MRQNCKQLSKAFIDALRMDIGGSTKKYILKFSLNASTKLYKSSSNSFVSWNFISANIFTRTQTKQLTTSPNEVTGWTLFINTTQTNNTLY
ncbi:hypothetical protein H5410_006260 [Solanum commersonii]|uniref:Uncharacterized protein n=1 Tax=Solanum commersonii TaxID=4109 RepID=A0A9J6A9X0_SOLCO|nr:hypothetical protein H5410_006260 [Solanum commersonii]